MFIVGEYMVKLKAVIFDLDGTLIDSVEAHVFSWITSFNEHGFRNVSHENVEKLIGLPGRTIVKMVLGEEGLKRYESIRRLKDSIFLKLVVEGKVKLHEHVIDVLTEIRKMGLKVCLATSTPSYLLEVILPRMRISELFDVIVPGDRVRKGKPEPEIFLRAFKEARVDPREGAVVGDSLYDIIPAKKIGSKAILVLHGRRIEKLGVKPDYVINDLSELVPIIRKLL